MMSMTTPGIDTIPPQPSKLGYCHKDDRYAKVSQYTLTAIIFM